MSTYIEYNITSITYMSHISMLMLLFWKNMHRRSVMDRMYAKEKQIQATSNTP